jgi:hypothetical protein
MAGEAQLRRELEHERQELAAAVDVLREDLGEAAQKAKRIPIAVGGAVALSVVAKTLARALGRRR